MKGDSVQGMVCAGSLALALTAAAQSTSKPAADPRTFDTPEQALDALVAAAAAYDVAALENIFGRRGRDLVATGDAVQDRNRAHEFAANAREHKNVALDPTNANLAIIFVGDDWPLPVPLVRRAGRWSFDAEAGHEEILNRRIGSNELDAIDVCRGFVEAQREYAQTKHDDSLVNQYARRIISTPGKQDGLAWRNADGSWGGPVGEAVARAIEQGYSERTESYHGYYFKVLRGQGPAAPLGELDFLVKGVMIGGFALVASPADYGVSGVQTFMVSHDGIVYEKDLGADTLSVFKTMERYDPDKTWSRMEERR